MSYTPEHKRQTRQRILSAAEKLFKTQGYEATGIDAIMAAAGLTRGGFYAHFSDKLDLFNHIVLPRSIAPARSDDADGRWAQLRSIFDYYFSPGHRDNPGDGCPLPALSTDVSKLGGNARKRYNRIFRGFRKIISGSLEDLPKSDRDRTAEAILTLMIGSVIVARALGTGATSDQVLNSARMACERLTASAVDPNHDNHAPDV